MESSEGSDTVTGQMKFVLGIILSMVVLAVSPALLSSCGGTATTDAGDSASSSTRETLPPATQSSFPSTTVTTIAKVPVSEPQFGETMRMVPDEIILSEGAQGFIPPDTLPLYRIVPNGPLTREAMDGVADRLGLGESRTYSSTAVPAGQGAVSDERWSIIFFRGDLDCFHLSDLTADREVTEGFEEGAIIEAVSPEEAIAVADEYLASLAYGAGLGPPEVFVRTSMGRAEGDAPMVSYVVTRGVSYGTEVNGLRLVGAGVVVDVGPGGRVMSFSHTIERAEQDSFQVAVMPVEEALGDVRSGKGQFPAQATREGMSTLVVESIELAYYSPPEGVEETYYKPVYVFHVLMADGTRGIWLVSAYRGIDGTAASGALPTPEEWVPKPWMQPHLIESYRAAYRDHYEATMAGGGPTLLPNNMPEEEVLSFHGER
jgi:hypothetical protein